MVGNVYFDIHLKGQFNASLVQLDRTPAYEAVRLGIRIPRDAPSLTVNADHAIIHAYVEQSTLFIKNSVTRLCEGSWPQQSARDGSILHKPYKNNL